MGDKTFGVIVDVRIWNAWTVAILKMTDTGKFATVGWFGRERPDEAGEPAWSTNAYDTPHEAFYAARPLTTWDRTQLPEEHQEALQDLIELSNGQYQKRCDVCGEYMLLQKGDHMTLVRNIHKIFVCHDPCAREFVAALQRLGVAT